MKSVCNIVSVACSHLKSLFALHKKQFFMSAKQIVYKLHCIKIVCKTKKCCVTIKKVMSHRKKRHSCRLKMYCVAEERNTWRKKLFCVTIKVMLHKKRDLCRFKIICVAQKRNKCRKKIATVSKKVLYCRKKNLSLHKNWDQCLKKVINLAWTTRHTPCVFPSVLIFWDYEYSKKRMKQR